jgi:hypothetical protein
MTSRNFGRCLPLAMGLVTLVAASVFAAPQPTLDDLVQDLRGNDEIRRSLARQLIPRHGIDGIPLLMPLLFHESTAVSWAANNTIRDIANDISVPGREAERAALATTLLDALAKNTVRTEQFVILRLLPGIVPVGVDLAAVESLLYQDDRKERARRTLQEIDTRGARSVLRRALPSADPEFACALMDALDKTEDTDAVPLLRAKLENGTDAERAAAARALARTANPKLAAPCLALCRGIDINHRFDAEDAALRLADAMARQGGKWEASMALYRALLEQSENSVIQGAALAGLGRFGDETALDTIMAAWSADASGLLEAPAMFAIETLQDPAVPDLLMAVYPDQPQPIQERLLGIMARTQDPRHLPLFEGAGHITVAIRIDALAQYHLPQAVPMLELLAKDTDPTNAMAAAGAIRSMATAFRDGDDHAGAGRAYLALYRIATDDGARSEALEGIKAYPVPEAYDELKNGLGEERLLNLPVQVLAGMARSLAEAQRPDEANSLKTALLSRAKDTGTVQQLIQMGPASGSHEDFARQLGFVNRWKVALPFPLEGAPANGGPVLVNGAVDLTATYGEGDTAIRWTPTTGGGAMALVNFSPQDQVRAFAHAILNVAAAQDATLRIGSDDGVRAWVNGAKVHENDTDRGTALDNDLVSISLKAGDNALLLEIMQHAGGWNFCARLTEPDGTPLKFEQK